MWHPSIFLDCPKRVRSLPPEVACVILPEGYFRPGTIPHWLGPRGPYSPKKPPKVKCQKIIEWVWVCGHKGNGNRSHKQFLETASPTKTTSCRPPPPPTWSDPSPSPPPPPWGPALSTPLLFQTYREEDIYFTMDTNSPGSLFFFFFLRLLRRGGSRRKTRCGSLSSLLNCFMLQFPHLQKRNNNGAHPYKVLGKIK